MTKNLSDSDKESGAVLRGVMDVLMMLMGCLAIGLFMNFSLDMIQELVHALGHSKLPLSWFGLAMDDCSSLPLGLPFIVVVPAVLMRISDLLCGRPARIPYCLLPMALVVVLMALAGVWAFEGGHLVQYLSPRDGRVLHHYASVSIGLAAAMTSSLILIGGARILGRRLGWLNVVGPLACIAWTSFLMATEPVFTDLGDCLPEMATLSYFTWNLLIVVTVVAAIAWLEWRLHGQLARTFFIASSALWATAALRTFMSVAPFHHMCLKIPANAIENGCVVGMQGIFVLEVIAIALLTLIRRRAAKARQAGNGVRGLPG